MQAYPYDSLWTLNQHINAYVKYEWKAKEPAILDLALIKGVEIPKVKELMDKGVPKKEAILEVSRNMRFNVKEAEVKKWVAEVTKEILKKRETPEERQRQRIERQIQDYEKTVEKLTVLFHKGDLNEESYKTAIRSLEEKMDKLTGKERKRAVSLPLEPEVYRTPVYKVRLKKPSGLWYLAPFFFGIIGGLIGYVGVKDEDEEMAQNLLGFGIFMTFVGIFVTWFWIFG